PRAPVRRAGAARWRRRGGGGRARDRARGRRHPPDARHRAANRRGYPGRRAAAAAPTPFASGRVARYRRQMTGPDRARELADRVRTGGLVLLLDDAIDPPEAVLVGAAARATPEAVNFMVTHGRGLVCLGLTRERMRRLGIPLIASEQSARLPAYGASIEARRGVSTGISASDRATTILAAVAPESTSADLVMPGHITPIQLVEGGSLVRAALPEAASDLMRLGGLGFEAGLWEVLGRDGNLATRAELDALARAHRLPVLTVIDVIQMRLRSDTLVRR